MNISLRLALMDETGTAFMLLIRAAESLKKKGIDQWSYWTDPPLDKIQWLKNGFINREFYFIENDQQQYLGMVRLLDDDTLYWGGMEDTAKYINSLVVPEQFYNNNLGRRVVETLGKLSKK
jgi:hypothetical protein